MTTPTPTPTLVRSPLSWRAEAGRQVRRRRTLWSFVLLLALPVIMVAAFALGDGEPDPGSLVDLATAGSANFAVFAVAVSASFLLMVLTALFVGDSLPSEASWSTLRYLLVAPVPRDRLLTSKLVVGVATTAVAIVTLMVWSLLVGGVFYGWDGFTNPLGGSLDWPTLAPRLVGVALYLLVSMTQVGAIAFCIGTRTDAPLGAVGGAVMVTIVAAILGQIDNLGSLRNGLPMHYSDAWLDLLSPTVSWTSLQHGVLWSLFYTGLFVGLGYAIFRRKDVLS
jgi:ABC-2 type transport system permease protein